ncbi:MAG: 16S rRNA (cytosine(1402)-N(4))-methyltransferase RsmH [Candidatus Binatia bacterium]|nr:16S rRNA (cytosine(1402)-N(4))-methyltransferase RsmH [Candidatus Binatia bacterium]MDG2011714.1 16S rRNA (cytosine(1402)-N(4))-methyltransferase RsmH [Candidatus Binatia bacterium]
MTWGSDPVGNWRQTAMARDEGMMEEPLHVPVMSTEVVDAMLGGARPGPLRLVDLTFGLGGHSRALLEAAPAGSEILSLDRDPEALSIARETLAPFGVRVHAVHACFSELPEQLAKLNWPSVDGVFGDLGVSSLQLDSPDRGFSFRTDAALDMRMDASHGETAADLLAEIDEMALTKVIRELGEEPAARRIARAICQEEPRPTTTAELRALVGRVAGGPRHHRRRIDPATLTFQALRICVNRELEELESVLAMLPEILASDGRAVFLAYHSLEDRRVKRAFREWMRACVCPRELLVCQCGGEPRAFAVVRGAMKPSADEVGRNPRARSARMRAIRWGGSDGRG